MERSARLVVPGLPHQLYLRGNNRRLVFASHADRLLWIDCIHRALDITKCRLHQMTLMKSSIHMIITPMEELGISDVVKRACERYAQLRNKRRKSSGRMFEVGFRSRVLVTTQELGAATLHCDSAAYRLGAATDPFIDQWSTTAVHSGRPEGRRLRGVWTPSPWYGGLASSGDARARAYRRVMAEYLEGDDAWSIEGAFDVEDAKAYKRRIERPDGIWARERQLQYASKGK